MSPLMRTLLASVALVASVFVAEHARAEPVAAASEPVVRASSTR